MLEQHIEHVDERHFPFAGHDHIDAVIEVDVGVIARIGTGDDNRHPPRLGRLRHRQRRLAHAQQAHLAQVVEAVLVNHGDARAMVIKRRDPFGLGRREHRVEHRHLIAARARGRGCIERAERRVRLLRVPELGVEPEEICLSEKNINHGIQGVKAGSRTAERAVWRTASR